jgi:hypothetical protein
MVERYAYLAPDNLAHLASRINEVFNGYDLAMTDQKQKKPISLLAISTWRLKVKVKLLSKLIDQAK